jgi:hypothetical protein
MAPIARKKRRRQSRNARRIRRAITSQKKISASQLAHD